MTPAAWFAVGCVACGFVGLLLGWAACLSLTQRRHRLGGLLDEEFFRRFVTSAPEPITSIRTLIEAEEWGDWSSDWEFMHGSR